MSTSTPPQHKKIRVVVSGGFDPIHPGHVRMFNEAKKLGDELIVIINNDNWLKKKKGYAFLTEQERKEIITSFRAVDKVVITGHTKNPQDMSVTKELRALKPDVFAQGGDRKPSQTPVPGSELEYCKQAGCKVVYNVGRGGKVQSSSWLTTSFLTHALQMNSCPCKSGKLFRECGMRNTKTHQLHLKKLLNGT